ncbi:hypothetical protein PTTG_10165 [Puccinia triticina 1-1 BBBD Race 1]|uniref:Peptidase A2 domain-containing protein n=1 Tax=Puccinia triticina (isolate 1-1 / race 1 (BBBD)) TaxID=630390 RepID=A0A0C4FAC4_PUCT1|nr:hypothetical protein PTTG_10165 [Puccinia triticina 1-1 BBBD Race 1]
MVKIKPQDRELKFNGKRVEAFLRQYELAANLDGASDEDKVLQIPSFLGSEDIQDAVWDMSGYTSKSWATLKEQMVERWGQFDVVRYTVADLQALKDSWSAKEGITTLEDYRSFKSTFDVILSYLIRYAHLSSEDLAVDYFFFSFASGFQQRIKSYLIKEKKMKKTLDGRYLLPALKELRAAATSEMEEEVAFTSKQVKTQATPPVATAFKESNDIMLKMEADRRPKDAPAQSKAPATVDDLSRMLQSFEQRLKKESSTVPPAASAPSNSCGPLVCYYCHREGHGTARCFELKKDKEEKLVEQKGTNFFLPNGALIPFDASRPIRHVVASFQPQAGSAATAEYRAACGSLDPWYPPAISSQTFSGYQSDPARKKHEAPKLYKAPAVPASAARKPPKKAPSPESGSEAEDMDIASEPFERSPASQPSPSVPSESAPPPAPAKSEAGPSRVRFERGIAKDHPKAVEGMLQKISNLPLTVTVAELCAVAPAIADGMKRWVSKRRVEVNAEELKVHSGTLVEESPPDEEENRLSSCPLGYLPCLLGEDEGNAAPLVDSGSQLNLISDAKATKFNLSPRVNFSSAVYGIGNQACELVGVAEDVPIKIGKTVLGTCHFWITRMDGPIILGRPFLMDFKASLEYGGHFGEKILLPDSNGRRIEISLCSIDAGRWERDFPGGGRKAILNRKGKAREDPVEGRHFL